MYDQGLVFHPATGEPVHWAFEDWSVNDGRRSVIATLREGLTWTDGEPVTAEDVAFTAEYVADDALFPFVGTRPAAVSDFIGAVAVDDRRVRYSFEAPDGRWQGLLALPILPEHVWSSVSTPEEYRPSRNGGPVGSGPFVVERFESELRVTLRQRDDVHSYPLGPTTHAVQEIDVVLANGEAEAVDRVRTGQADAVLTDLQVSRAADLRGNNGVDLVQSPSDGFEYAAFNLRRTPLDDAALRRTLANAFDERYLVEHGFRGFHAEGDLPIPDAFSYLRPSSPPGDTYAFPGSSGSPVDVDAARSFLLDQGDAGHAYSFDDAVSGVTTAPDNRELYVDGEPLVDAHTDNDGAGGQGTLEVAVPVAYPAPRRDAYRKWVEDLQRIGVPVELAVVEFAELIRDAFRTESFDCYVLGWRLFQPSGESLYRWFHSDSADLTGDDDAFVYNATGYEGADAALESAREAMDPARRREALVDAAERVYEDCPMAILGYRRSVQPVAPGTSWVRSPQGVANRFTYLGGEPIPGGGTPPTPEDGPSAPTVETRPANPQVGASVTFEVVEPADDATYAWDVGADGTVDGEGETFTRAFEEAGDHEVEVDVIDEEGRTATTSVTVTVRPNDPPEAAVDVSPAEPSVGEQVIFDAEGSTDPDGTIVHYEWDVGDDGNVDGDGQTLSHAFEEAGEYAVRLRVVDDAGADATTRTTVSVTDTTPSLFGESGDDPGGEPTGDSTQWEATPGFGVVSAAVAAGGALAALARRAREMAE